MAKPLNLYPYSDQVKAVIDETGFNPHQAARRALQDNMLVALAGAKDQPERQRLDIYHAVLDLLVREFKP